MKTYKPDGVIRILPNPRSSGIEPAFNTFYRRKTVDDILDGIDLKDIEKYLRKKKLQQLQNK